MPPLIISLHQPPTPLGCRHKLGQIPFSIRLIVTTQHYLILRKTRFSTTNRVFIGPRDVLGCSIAQQEKANYKTILKSGQTFRGGFEFCGGLNPFPEGRKKNGRPQQRPGDRAFFMKIRFVDSRFFRLYKLIAIRQGEWWFINGYGNAFLILFGLV